MRGNFPDRSAVGHTRSGRAAPQNRHSAMKSLMRPDQSTRSAPCTVTSSCSAPACPRCCGTWRASALPLRRPRLRIWLHSTCRSTRGTCGLVGGAPHAEDSGFAGAQTHSQRTLRRTACAIHRDAHRNSDHWRSYRRGGTTRRAAAELRRLGPSANTSQASCCLRLDALDSQVVCVLTRWLKRL